MLSVYQVWKCPEKVKGGEVDGYQFEEFQKIRTLHFIKMKAEKGCQ